VGLKHKLYGCETWTVTKTLTKRLDAFDTWCLRKILRIPYTRNKTQIQSTTGCSPVSERVTCSRLKFFATIWLGQPRRKTITVSSPAHCDRHLTGGDQSVQEPPGWERSTMTFSPRTLESTRHGGRQGTGGLATSRQYGNAQLGLEYATKKKKKHKSHPCKVNERVLWTQPTEGQSRVVFQCRIPWSRGCYRPSSYHTAVAGSYNRSSSTRKGTRTSRLTPSPNSHTSTNTAT